MNTSTKSLGSVSFLKYFKENDNTYIKQDTLIKTDRQYIYIVMENVIKESCKNDF